MLHSMSGESSSEPRLELAGQRFGGIQPFCSASRSVRSPGSRVNGPLRHDPHLRPRSHALIAPDSHVHSDLPGWERSRGIILISPRMGAVRSVPRPHGAWCHAGPAPPAVERVLYVLEGEVALTIPAQRAHPWSGGVRVLPARCRRRAPRVAASRLNVFQRVSRRPGLAVPGPFCGDEQDRRPPLPGRPRCAEAAAAG